jgi:hypothetical protein
MFEEYLIEELKKHFPHLDIQKDDLNGDVVIRSTLKNIRIAYNPEVCSYLNIVCCEYMPNETWCKTSSHTAYKSITDLIAYLTYAIHRL